MNRDDDMSNTFVSEVGQRSAIFKKKDEEIESLEDNKTVFPDVKIDPPTQMPSILEEKKNNEPIKKAVEEEDEEFLETNKKKKSKKYKKRNPFVTFLIMIVCIALGAGGSYYYFEVYTDNTTEKVKTTVKETEENIKKQVTLREIKPDSLYIKELISNYDYSGITNAVIYPVLYANEKTNIKDIDETYLRALAATKANKSLGDAVFSSDDFQNAVTMLYGNEIVLEDKAISIDNGCTKIDYQNSYYSTTIGECGGASAYNLVRKIVKAVEEKDTLKVNVAIAITDGNKVYKSYDNTTGASNEIVGVPYQSFDIEKDYTKLNQYKYTFNYDKDNNNYYLTTIELIK